MNYSENCPKYTKLFVPDGFGATIGSMNQTESIFVCHKSFIQDRKINGFDCKIKCLEAPFMGYADEVNITPKQGSIIHTIGGGHYTYNLG